MPLVRALLVSPDEKSRQQMRVIVSGLRLRLGASVEFLESTDGERAASMADRESPDLIVVDEIASRAGAFALVKELRDRLDPFPGVVVILLERRHDSWLAEWSGADAWFVKPLDPFAVTGRIAELVADKERV
jgi:DNA-binding response OmpR family regulator